MASFTTVSGGDKFFPYKEALNAVHPDHGDAMFFIPKHNGHISINPWIRNFWEYEEIDDNFSYTLGEDSLRLLQLAKYENLNVELQFEALMFNFHKVYPPGDKVSPELSEKGLMGFDEKYVQKTRRLIKANSIAVREAFGIKIEVSEEIIELHRDLQANVLYYLQHKTDDELELMDLPDHDHVYNLISINDKKPKLDLSGKIFSNLIPSDVNLVRKVWWNEFKNLGGAERFNENGLHKWKKVCKK